jgi:hypothetical protein
VVIGSSAVCLEWSATRATAAGAIEDCSGPMGTSVRLSLMTAGSSILKPLRGAEASRSGRL